MKSYYEFNYGLEVDVGDLFNKGKELWHQHAVPALHQLAQHSDDARKSIRNIRHTLKEGGDLVDDVKGFLKGGDEAEEEASKSKEEAEKGWSTTHKVAAGVGATAGVGALGYGAYKMGQGSNN